MSDMWKIKIVIGCVWLMLATAGTSSAQGWRGLIPLHSTRQDVERVLGAPTGYYYNLSNETVDIDYASGACLGDRPDSYKVPAGTVTRIMVIPKSEPSLKALRVDITRYKKKVEDVKPHVFYYDEEAGESIEVFDGKVQSITYTPKASQASLRCYSSFDDWMTANNIACVLSTSKFDEFGVVSISEERLRLENLALQLTPEFPHSRGWIIVYGGKKDGMKAALRRAKRIKHFLVKQSGIASGRILTMAAGPLDEPLVEVWMATVGERLPTPRPQER